jgi:hypothetical protein
VRLESRGLIDLHHDAGRDTYIVSASPIEIVDDLADAMGMTGGIGTVAEIVDGVYTGRLAEPFCYGEGKARAIEKLAEEKGYDLRLSYAYSDSAGDLPFLEMVGHPVARPSKSSGRPPPSPARPGLQLPRTSSVAARAGSVHDQSHHTCDHSGGSLSNASIPPPTDVACLCLPLRRR